MSLLVISHLTKYITLEFVPVVIRNDTREAAGYEEEIAERVLTDEQVANGDGYFVGEFHVKKGEAAAYLMAKNKVRNDAAICVAGIWEICVHFVKSGHLCSRIDRLYVVCCIYPSERGCIADVDGNTHRAV